MIEKTRVLAVAICMVVSGCSSDSTLPEEDSLVTVTGVVAQIDDKVPVDGGVTITLELDEGGTELLLFGSLFACPSPCEEGIALYRKIKTAKVGSRVRATGIRGDWEGVFLTDLVVLD